MDRYAIVRGAADAARGERSRPDIWVYTPARHKIDWRGQVRRVPLGPRCIELLKPLQAKARKNAPVFPAKHRQKRTIGPYTAFSYAQATRRAGVAAGIPGFHPYQLRHGAKMRIEAEVGAEAARAILGHRSIQTTTHYRKLDLDRASDVMKKLG